MGIGVWANSRDVPGVVCSDARLTDRSHRPWPWESRPIATKDQPYGQTGWDIGINFANLSDLAAKLSSLQRPNYVAGTSRTIGRGEINRLAIHAHGVSGIIFIDGTDAKTKLTASTAGAMRADLNKIGLMTPEDPRNPAVILFVGCLAGSGRDGTALLTTLSGMWPNRKVVGFATLGFVAAGEMLRTAQQCNEPGMRDTTELWPGAANDKAGRYWNDLKAWPWASESSARAKVALNRQIILGGNW